MQNNPNAQFSREQLKQLLDLTYDLEGLLTLAISRDDMPLGLEERILSKLASLSVFDYTKDTEIPTDPKEYKAPEIREVTEIPEITEEPEVTEAPEASAPVRDSFDSYDLDDEDPEQVSETEDPEDSEIPKENSSDKQAVKEILVIDSPGLLNNAPILTKQTPVFSINDRFLFTRELFGGRISDFEDALKTAASMDSYEEAEDYFISERGFNPELPIVQDFLAVISNCFV